MYINFLFFLLVSTYDDVVTNDEQDAFFPQRNEKLFEMLKEKWICISCTRQNFHLIKRWMNKFMYVHIASEFIYPGECTKDGVESVSVWLVYRAEVIPISRRRLHSGEELNEWEE